ncbi:hypothetical protein ANRL4_02332 [Anaerolineae bacterium]|nr:hypothetical protein ANRL4_02332 [Anaerolineae bacterium]
MFHFTDDSLSQNSQKEKEWLLTKQNQPECSF